MLLSVVCCVAGGGGGDEGGVQCVLVGAGQCCGFPCHCPGWVLCGVLWLAVAAHTRLSHCCLALVVGTWRMQKKWLAALGCMHLHAGP